jgi:hypothetical protein
VALVGSIVLAGVAIPAQQQSSHTEPTQDVTYLRVLHASQDAEAVDVYVDDEQVASNVTFGNASEYANLTSGAHTVEITAADDPNATVFDGIVDLEAGTANTLAATSEVGDDGTLTSEPVLYEDGALDPGANQSAVRAVHLSSDAPPVNVTTTLDGETVALANGTEFGNGSDYVNVPAGTYTIEIRDATATDDGNDTDGNETDGNDTDGNETQEDVTADEDADVIATVEVTLEPGTAYTALAIGSVDANETDGDGQFTVTTIEDPIVTLALPGEEKETTTTTTTTETTTIEVSTPTETTTTTTDVGEGTNTTTDVGEGTTTDVGEGTTTTDVGEGTTTTDVGEGMTTTDIGEGTTTTDIGEGTTTTDAGEETTTTDIGEGVTTTTRFDIDYDEEDVVTNTTTTESNTTTTTTESNTTTETTTTEEEDS